MARPSYDDLNGALRSNFEALVLDLLGEPSGCRGSSHDWRYGRKGSLSVTVRGPRCGRWRDFERSESGGPLDLIMRKHRCSLEDAAAWATSWLGLEPSTNVVRLPESRPNTIEQDPSDLDDGNDAERTRKTAYAARLFNACDRLEGNTRGGVLNCPRSHGATWRAAALSRQPEAQPERVPSPGVGRASRRT